MKTLNKDQVDFLEKEFGIENIDYSNKEELNEIRMKCFDVEVDETCDRLDAGIDEESVGDRGDTATSIIDDLYDIIHS
jgi:hypothetical protein